MKFIHALPRHIFSKFMGSEEHSEVLTPWLPPTVHPAEEIAGGPGDQGTRGDKAIVNRASKKTEFNSNRNFVTLVLRGQQFFITALMSFCMLRANS